MRHILRRKTWFYRVLLPALRRLDARTSDRILMRLGRIAATGRRLEARLDAMQRALDAPWNAREAARNVAENLSRFQARDVMLAGLRDEALASRFEVVNAHHLDDARACGAGPILLGSHFGGYLAALRWLDQEGVAMRMLVQRPHHVSAELSRLLDADPNGPLPQEAFFLRRRMPPGEGARKVLLSRAAMRDGMALYIHGDVAWPSGCARPGRLLGQDRRFLGLWADLAAWTGAPVVTFFCRHLPGGRFAIEFDEPFTIAPGQEQAAVERYLARLETMIRRHPAEAIAYLLWPSFANPPGPNETTAGHNLFKPADTNTFSQANVTVARSSAVT